MSKREPRDAFALDTPAPGDGKGVGETRSLRLTASAPLGRGRETEERTGSDLTAAKTFVADSSFRYLADALAF